MRRRYGSVSNAHFSLKIKRLVKVKPVGGIAELFGMRKS